MVCVGTRLILLLGMLCVVAADGKRGIVGDVVGAAKKAYKTWKETKFGKHIDLPPGYGDQLVAQAAMSNQQQTLTDPLYRAPDQYWRDVYERHWLHPASRSGSGSGSGATAELPFTSEEWCKNNPDNCNMQFQPPPFLDPQFISGMSTPPGSQWGVTTGNMPTRISPGHAEEHDDWPIRPDRYVYERPMDPPPEKLLKDPAAILKQRFEMEEVAKGIYAPGNVISQFKNPSGTISGKKPELHPANNPQKASAEGKKPKETGF